MAEYEGGKDKQIREAYESKHGSMRETLDILNEGKPAKDRGKFTMEDVRRWYAYNKGTLKKQKGYNSYVAPEPLHEIQVDLFEYTFKQPGKMRVKPKDRDWGPRERINRAATRAMTVVPPYGLIAIDSFTKKSLADNIKMN